MGNKDVNVNFRVTEELRDKLASLAKARGMTTSKLLRSYMEELVYGDKTRKARMTRVEDSTSYEDMVGIRCTKELHEQFFRACEKNGVMPTKVLRGFMTDYARLMTASREVVSLESTLAYLGIFLQNAMLKQGYAIVTREDAFVSSAYAEHPLIEEMSRSSDRVIWKIYDEEQSYLHAWVFRRIKD